MLLDTTFTDEIWSVNKLMIEVTVTDCAVVFLDVYTFRFLSVFLEHLIC